MGSEGTAAVAVQQGQGAPGVARLADSSGGPESAAPFDAVLQLQRQLTERDEIIVALQHVIRELNHEIENRRVERAYLSMFGTEVA